MKIFSVFLADGQIIQIQAKRYRREGEQYVFERDTQDEDVQFIMASEVKGILEGAFSRVPRRPHQ
jgi:hypothetical protein